VVTTINDEMIGLLGQFSKELLGDHRFKAMVELFNQQMAADMLNTAPHEHKKREGVYAAYQGFSEFTKLVQQFSDAFDSIYTEQQSSTDTDEDQGFED
jgi:predicted ATPase